MSKPVAFSNLSEIAWLILALVVGLLWLPLFIACFLMPVAGLIVGGFLFVIPVVLLVFSARAMNARRDMIGVPAKGMIAAILLGELALFIAGVVVFNFILKITALTLH